MAKKGGESDGRLDVVLELSVALDAVDDAPQLLTGEIVEAQLVAESPCGGGVHGGWRGGVENGSIEQQPWIYGSMDLSC